jgi:hypothetical protein
VDSDWIIYNNHLVCIIKHSTGDIASAITLFLSTFKSVLDILIKKKSWLEMVVIDRAAHAQY